MATFIVAGVSEEKKGVSYEKNPDQVWIVSYPDGARRAIGEVSSSGVEVAADGKRILATQTVEGSDVVVLKRGDPRFIKRILSGTNVNYSLCWTLGGELIISSNDAGTYDLYVLNPETGARRQLTFDSTGDERVPTVSPDGKYVVFVSSRGETKLPKESGEMSVWRIGLDGTGLVRLTPPYPRRSSVRSHVSPDGKWVLFMDWDRGPQLSVVSIEGGTPRVIKGPQGVDPSPGNPIENAFGGAWSQSGRELAFFYFTRAETLSPVEIVVTSPEGRIQKRFPLSTSPAIKVGSHLQWSPDARFLYFVHYQRDGNLWRQPVAGGPAERVTTEDIVEDFDWSPDGKSLAYSRVIRLSDVVLISNFR